MGKWSRGKERPPAQIKKDRASLDKLLEITEKAGNPFMCEQRSGMATIYLMVPLYGVIARSITNKWEDRGWVRVTKSQKKPWKVKVLAKGLRGEV